MDLSVPSASSYNVKAIRNSLRGDIIRYYRNAKRIEDFRIYLHLASFRKVLEGNGIMVLLAGSIVTSC